VARFEREGLMRETFSRQLLESQEAERKRIAGELHDGLGQSLSIIQNRAALAISETDTGPRAGTQVTSISQAAGEALASVREICHDLRPVELDRLGLSKTLQAVAERAGSSAGLRVMAEIDPVDAFVSDAHWIHLLRFVQEALNNVMKHARATEVQVSLREDDDCLRLSISDNGIGFNPAAAGRGRSLGLSTLEERARILKAQFHVESALGKGTKMRLDIPKNESC
jgi:signal transduction histidine kinase